MQKMTLEEACAEFLLYEKSVRSLSENTVISYGKDLDAFQKFLGKDRLMDDLTLEDLRSCIGELSRQKKAAASVNRFIASVRSLFAYCRKFQYIQNNVALELKNVKLPRHLPVFMTGAEIDSLCECPEKTEILWAARDKALFEMLYSSGCRISEIAALKFEDLSKDFSSAFVTGKGRKDRQVFFGKDAVEALKVYLDERKKRFAQKEFYRLCPEVFVNQHGKKLSVAGMRWIVSVYSGTTGVNHHVSPHAFRHTFATQMISSGADVRAVQAMLGHSSISTTQRYTHITTEKLIEIYNHAHPHGGNKK